MPDFWENVLRFPMFFISSSVGLIFTITGPFLNLLKRPKTSLIFLIVILALLLGLILTLKSMLEIT